VRDKCFGHRILRLRSSSLPLGRAGDRRGVESTQNLGWEQIFPHQAFTRAAWRIRAPTSMAGSVGVLTLLQGAAARPIAGSGANPRAEPGAPIASMAAGDGAKTAFRATWEPTPLTRHCSALPSGPGKTGGGPVPRAGHLGPRMNERCPSLPAAGPGRKNCTAAAIGRDHARTCAAAVSHGTAR
jgi:hypothetical protein